MVPCHLYGDSKITNDTPELIYKIETESQTQEGTYGSKEGRVGDERELGSLGSHVHSVKCFK